MIVYIIGLISGLAATLQGSVNARIREIVKSPYITSILNFATAITALIVIVLVIEGDLYMYREEIQSQPDWILLGGLCGVVIVILGTICIPVIGSARNVTLLCFGQIMTGLLIDNFGLFGAPVTKMSVLRTVGAVLSIIGITLITIEKSGAGMGAELADRRMRRYLLLPVVAGFACAVQVAVNGTLGAVIGSWSKATLISMTSGLVNTILIMLVIRFFAGRMALYSTADGREVREEDIKRPVFKWILLCGGPLGVIIVGGNAIVAPVAGTGVTTMLNLLGMMVSGLAIDAAGFLGIEKKPVTLRKVAGMVIMLTGTAMITLV